MAFAGAAFWLLALVHLGAQAVSPGGTTAAVTQVLLMPLLAMTLIAQTRALTPLVKLTLGALFFSWLGDSLPRAVGDDLEFLVMVGCFLVAQLIYAVAFWPWRSQSVLRTPAVAAYVVIAIGLVWWCADGAGSLLIPVIVYAIALATMAILATGLGWLAGLGGAVFMLSDSLIALRAFADVDLPWHSLWVMATYIAAQLMLVTAVIDENKEVTA